MALTKRPCEVPNASPLVVWHYEGKLVMRYRAPFMSFGPALAVIFPHWRTWGEVMLPVAMPVVVMVCLPLINFKTIPILC